MKTTSEEPDDEEEGTECKADHNDGGDDPAHKPLAPLDVPVFPNDVCWLNCLLHSGFLVK